MLLIRTESGSKIGKNLKSLRTTKTELKIESPCFEIKHGPHLYIYTPPRVRDPKDPPDLTGLGRCCEHRISGGLLRLWENLEQGNTSGLDQDQNGWPMDS